MNQKEIVFGVDALELQITLRHPVATPVARHLLALFDRPSRTNIAMTADATRGPVLTLDAVRRNLAAKPMPPQADFDAFGF